MSELFDSLSVSTRQTMPQTVLFTVADRFPNIRCKFWCWNAQNCSQIFICHPCS